MGEGFDKVIPSPIRWAGSKKKLLNEMLDVMFVKNKTNYIEPFLGSGVVLINVLKNISVLKYKKFYVNDINENIINFYEMLKNDFKGLTKNIKKLEKEYNSYILAEQEKMYYKMRSAYNNQKTEKKLKASIFYFLMKSGFNGVYRENMKGEFNVPFGKKERINVNYADLMNISELIQNVEFYNMDYGDFLKMLRKRGKIRNSFIYCDPPYLPEDKCITKRVDIYTKNSFEHEKFFDNIKQYNAYVMISLAKTSKTDIIYKKDGFNRVAISTIVRTINPTKTFTSEEIAYINYKCSQ